MGFEEPLFRREVKLMDWRSVFSDLIVIRYESKIGM